VYIIASAREAGGNRGGDSGNAGRGETVFAVQAKGAPRRCGGLGDILTGVTAVALNWALQVLFHTFSSQPQCVLLCVLYCVSAE
jgi:NAD(P)H-hydrate repair Nnr-like enzyme with NAD(P)H-hydrate dehydratase domain